MKLYISKYIEYNSLPDKLFCENTPSHERKSLDGLEFLARCADHAPGEGCLVWMKSDEVEVDPSVLSGPDWAEADDA